MVTETIEAKRPISITLLSIFLVLGNLLAFYSFIRDDYFQGRGLLEILYIVLAGVVSVACGTGFWLMKKWAVYTYAVLAVIIQVALLVMGRWRLMTLLIPVIVIFFGYRNFSKMSSRLTRSLHASSYQTAR